MADLGKIFNSDDSICAIATGSTTSAISVIRISGSKTFEAIDHIFEAKKTLKSIADLSGYTQSFGTIRKGDQIIDEVIISVYHSPKSYTGEDSAEISCHGSPYIRKAILELLQENGVRLAEPGEFTMRAYTNGKLDLTQAEAVGDLIDSVSEGQHKLAMSQLKGNYSSKIGSLRHSLLNFASLIELELDFAEEEVEFANRTQFIELLSTIKQEIIKLIDSFRLGKVIKSGIPVAIIGKPNVGKSTLLNVLLEEDRAIVSDIPGTTRDIIEDTINIKGYLFRFIDTAGIRESHDVIEKIGIKKTFDKIGEASIILYLFEGEPELEITDLLKDIPDGKKVIMIKNKIDLTNWENQGNLDIIGISAKKGIGIHDLEAQLLSWVESFNISDNSVVVNARHIGALNMTLDSIKNIEFGFESGIPTDLVAIDVREALFHLGSITGEITTDELLGNIFGKFCIGK